MADALGTPPAAATPTVGVVSDEDHRIAMAGMIAPQTSSLAVRTGVLWGPGTTSVVSGTAATGTMTYGIALHHAVTTRGTADGIYLGPNLEAATTVATTAAPGSNSRIDIIYVKQNDTASTVSADSGTHAPLYGVANGTAAASPVAPTLPTGAIELGRATVAAGATSTNGAGVTITQTSVQTVARGADIPVRSVTERNALTAYVGLSVKRLDDGGRVERWTGSAWAASGDVPVLASIAARNAYFSGNLRAGASALVAGNLHVYDGTTWRFTLTGTATVTSDAVTGTANVAHGAGQAPTNVQLTPVDSGDSVNKVIKWMVQAFDATNIQVRAVRTDSSQYLLGNAGLNVLWAARF